MHHAFRRTSCLYLLLAALVGCASPAVNEYDSRASTGSPEPQERQSRTVGSPPPAQVARSARQSMVTVRSFAHGERIAEGSGFFVRRDGVIATNFHVIVDASNLKIELDDGEIYDTVLVVSLDERRDLVLLKVPMADARPLKIGDDRDLDIAEKVYAIGSPLGFKSTFTDGILSGRTVTGGVSYLQVTAPISPGSSGGAILDKFGNVIGISTATIEGGQNLNFAIPARHIEGLLELDSNTVRFEEFAEALKMVPANEQEGRSDETRAIIENLSPEAKEELSEYLPFERQILARLLAYSLTVEEYDFEMTDHVRDGLLVEGATEGFYVTLGPGNYLALGVCDDDCADLDVAVLDSADQIIARDVDLDAEALVQFTTARNQTVYIGAKMVECQTIDCGYMLALYSEE